MEKSANVYDDVLRLVLQRCTKLILPLINEVFGENYSGDEEIRFRDGNHFMDRPAGSTQKLITDAEFVVFRDGEAKAYHWECQSTSDSSMLLRIWEYDSQVALINSKVECTRLVVDFPRTALLYLRDGRNTPDEMEIVIRTPGTDGRYTIPVVKMSRYTADELFRKHLLFLVPFYGFTQEKRLAACEKDPGLRKALALEYKDLAARLDGELAAGRLNEYTKSLLLSVMVQVVRHVAKNYGDVLKEVDAAMSEDLANMPILKLCDEAEARGVANRNLELATDFVLHRGMSMEEAEKAFQVSRELLEQSVAGQQSSDQTNEVQPISRRRRGRGR